jgi:hypothetical protein
MPLSADPPKAAYVRRQTAAMELATLSTLAWVTPAMLMRLEGIG